MRKVWYIKNIEARMDLQDARRFGQMYPILADISPWSIFQQQKQICEQVLPIADVSDLIIQAGPATMLSTVAALWFERFSKINYLVWDVKQSIYVEMFLDRRLNPV